MTIEEITDVGFFQDIYRSDFLVRPPSPHTSTSPLQVPEKQMGIDSSNFVSASSHKSNHSAGSPSPRPVAANGANDSVRGTPSPNPSVKQKVSDERAESKSDKGRVNSASNENAPLSGSSKVDNSGKASYKQAQKPSEGRDLVLSNADEEDGNEFNV